MFQQTPNGGMNANGSVSQFQTTGTTGNQGGAGTINAHMMANGNGSQAGNNNGSGSSMSQLIYPALHLQPLNDTFAPKQICLAPPGPMNRIKIGRQTNNKTIPQPNNGYFDSKVLSRMHAEVWSQDGKVFIKDVKSSNGTFINGARLSPEGQESDTFELHTDDVVEFGIDIVGEDNKSIIHHKVACRVFLVMTAEEALGLRHDFAALYRGGIAGSTLNHHAVGPGAEGGLRRSKIGGSGYGTTGSANGMMSFDHILHRLQAELQKSRETAGELGTLNNAMQDIGETLGGGLPPMQNPPYQHLVPSATGPTNAQAAAREEEQRQKSANESSARAAEIKALEDQVKATHNALQSHIDRLTAFEARLEDNEGIKADIAVIREQVRNARTEASEARQMLASKRAGAEEDMDDGASVVSIDTVVPSEDARASNYGLGSSRADEAEALDSIEHVTRDDDENEDDEDANVSRESVSLLKRLKEHIGPLAPADDETMALDRQMQAGSTAYSPQRDEELHERIQAMESQLERALEIGRNLATQHAEANENVRRLEERIKSLELDQTQVRSLGTDEQPTPAVKKEVEEAESAPEPIVAATAAAAEVASASAILEILEKQWGQWREVFESDFAKERSGLLADREDVRRVVRMWDNLNQEVEDLVEGAYTDDGGNPGSDEPHQDRTIVASSVVANAAHNNFNQSKKKKKRKGGNNHNHGNNTGGANHNVAQHAAMLPQPMTSRRTTTAVGLGASAELNRHLRALIYTDDYNLLVRDTHMESEGSTSASSSVSDTSRSAASKMTDDTSVASSSGGAVGEKGAAGTISPSEGGSGTGTSLADLPDGVRKRAMAHLASGRRKARGANRWTDFGHGGLTGHGFDNAAALPAIGAVSVLAVGMTAWILAGKGFNPGGG